MPSLVRFLTCISASAVALTGAAAFAADDYPSRPIQHIYPWNASGPTFAVSQIIATAMGEELGGTVTTVAKPGAVGMNAFKAAMAEPADGYTTIDGYLAPLVIVPMNGGADHSYRDFIPLHFSTSNAFAIVSRADETRWDDIEGLIAHLKANPGGTRYSAGPDLALPHMVGAMVMQHNETISRHVPYSEINDAAKDLRSGILDWMVITPGVYKSNENHLKVLAVMTDQNDATAWYNGAPLIHTHMPEFPLSGLGSVGWTWWLVKSGTPMDIVQKLRDAQAAALARDDVRAKVAELGFVMNGYTSDQYEEIVAPVQAMLEAAKGAIEWEKEAIAGL